MRRDLLMTRRLVPALVGLVVCMAGVLLAWAIFSAAQASRVSAPPGEWLVIFAPTLFIGGGVMLVRGLCSCAGPFSRRNILITGIIELIVGGWPWLWTGWVVGGRPGNEGAGMLGTLIFLLVGLPGLLLTLIGVALKGWEPEELD